MNVPDLDGARRADEAGEQREQRTLVGADLHAGGSPEVLAGALLERASTSSGGAVRSAM